MQRGMMNYLTAVIALTIGFAAMMFAIGASANAQSNVIWPNDDCQFAPPIAGSGAVDVTDLLFLLSEWGPC